MRAFQKQLTAFMMEKDSCIALALFGFTLVLFSYSAFNGFVSMDDWRYLTSNPHVQAGITWQTVLWSFRSVDASNWHPLAYLSSALDCQIFGLNPTGHHLVSALIHAASASLLYFILMRMCEVRSISAACAAIFSAHPLRVESVVWAAERKDVLATFFLLLTVLCYVRYVKRPSAASYWAWTIAFVLGVLSKPIVMTTPALLLLLDYWPLRQFDKDVPANLRIAVLRKAPHFLIAFGAGMMAVHASRRGGDLIPMSGIYSASNVAANAIVSIVLYLWKTVWPVHLYCYYLPQSYVPAWECISCAIIVAIITCFCLLRGRRSPWLIVGWLWFLVGVAPVLGFPQAGLQSMADRYTYIPSIGLFFAAAMALAQWQMSSKLTRRLLPPVLGALLLALAALTVRQIGFWKNSISLYSHAVAIDPENWYVQAALGEALGAEGLNDGAQRHLAESQRLHPGQAMIEYDLGNLLVGRGDDAAAQWMYARAVQSDPGFAAARRKWASVLYRTGRLQQAAEQFQIYLQTHPADASAHNNLGAVLALQGRTEQAVAQFNQALSLDPALTNARINLGRLHPTTRRQ